MPIARPRSAAALALLLATLASCQKDPNPDDTADEYLEDPGQGLVPPSCKWDSEPDPPKGMIMHGISESILLDGAESCAELDFDEVDRTLIEKYKSRVIEGCEPEPFELLRNCYATMPGWENCIFTAYFFSNCELVTSE